MEQGHFGRAFGWAKGLVARVLGFCSGVLVTFLVLSLTFYKLQTLLGKTRDYPMLTEIVLKGLNKHQP